MRVEGCDYCETSRQPATHPAPQSIAVPGKAGRDFGHYSVQPQPLRKRAVHPDGRAVPQVCGLLRCFYGLHLRPLRGTTGETVPLPAESMEKCR